MDSPPNTGDTTTNSISNQLYGTHLLRSATASVVPPNVPPTVTLAVFSGQKFIQISVDLAGAKNITASVLRRVQDSYVNVSQMLRVLVMLEHYTPEQIDAFLSNEIVTNTQYMPETYMNSLPLFNDFTNHEVHQIRGLWIPFDKAIALAVKFDIYKLFKQLFLVDVHDFDMLPKSDLEPSSSSLLSSLKCSFNDLDSSLASSVETPIKKRKSTANGTALSPLSLKKLVAANTNYPYTLQPLAFHEKNRDLIAEAKLLFNEIFKAEDKDQFTKEDVETRLRTIVDKCRKQDLQPSIVFDVPLDQCGKTALHYAATLACEKLAQSLIELKICSPIRGDNKGESPLTATIQVTNAMVKGNFANMLDTWLWTNLWLFDSKNQSFLYYLILLAVNNGKSSRFYLGKILEWVMASSSKKQHLDILCNKIVNAQETKSGNTALHLAGESGLKWYIYILLELNADLSLSNNMGVKPTSFNCVNQVVDVRKAFKSNPASPAATSALLGALDADEDTDGYLVLLVHTGMEFWVKLLPFPDVGQLEDEQQESEKGGKELTPTSEVFSSSLLSNKIFKSIQELLSDTNNEYERVIHAKRAEINSLNRELRDATIVTANNRLIAKNIAGKMAQIDTMKLQIMNINDKMQMLKLELSRLVDEDVFNPQWEIDVSGLEKYDADEPFLIRAIYDKLVQGEDVNPTPELVKALPPLEVLRARLQAYEEMNANLERELETLVGYGGLTAQFKKVVSTCTGVDVNEVDELLDGLLEAVEGQQ